MEQGIGSLVLICVGVVIGLTLVQISKRRSRPKNLNNKKGTAGSSASRTASGKKKKRKKKR